MAARIQAGYDLNYAINANNCQQISNIAEQSYRTEGTGANSAVAKTSVYSYDANGNLLAVNTGKRTSDSTLQATNSRRLLWDEENRLLALSDNGFVSNYWYDAAGERTVKLSGDAAGVNINGLTAGALTGTSNFTAYISPYLVVRNGGEYTKHIYMGSQRITSKVGGFFTASNSPVESTALQAKYVYQTAKIKERFDSLGVKYSGTEKSGSLISSTPSGAGGSYFYHSDHLGSSSLITDAGGNVTQHVEYVPFGEVFLEERNATWSTPYKFNGKERDEETGLSYYGARYYDPRTSVWLSVDPLMNDYLNTNEFDNIFNSKTLNSYAYTFQNPVGYQDYEGGLPIFIITGGIGALINTGINVWQQIDAGTFDLHSGKTWARIGVAAGSGFIAGATGNIAVAATSNAVGNFSDQLIDQDGELSKVNYTSVAVSGVLGASSTKMAKMLLKAPGIKGLSLNLADRLSPYIAKNPAYKLGTSSFYIKTGTTPFNYTTNRLANAFSSLGSNLTTGIGGLPKIPDFFRFGYNRWFSNKDGNKVHATVTFEQPRIVGVEP